MAFPTYNKTGSNTLKKYLWESVANLDLVVILSSMICLLSLSHGRFLKKQTPRKSCRSRRFIQVALRNNMSERLRGSRIRQWEKLA